MDVIVKMDIIVNIIILFVGFTIGFGVCAVLWVRELHRDLTKIDLELAKVIADINWLDKGVDRE